MIPYMILLGLLAGGWWRLALTAAAITWPIALYATNVTKSPLTLLAGSALAIINAAVGAAVHQGFRWAIGRVRGKPGRCMPAQRL